MDITLFRDQRQGIDWLATGKYSLCFFCNHTRVEQARSQGLPVESFGLMKEGAALIASGGAISLLNRAPHPNAAKVLINWYLSREGQLAVQSVEGSSANSRRMDIPKDMVPPHRRIQPGVRYVEVETAERMAMEPVLNLYTAALAEAERRKKR
jgi:ABC-type Fe3+ transport system substrate-binding protein